MLCFRTLTGPREVNKNVLESIILSQFGRHLETYNRLGLLMISSSFIHFTLVRRKVFEQFTSSALWARFILSRRAVELFSLSKSIDQQTFISHAGVCTRMIPQTP